MTRDQEERLEVTEVSRRGAHRARQHPALALLPLLALATLVLVLGWVTWMLFGRGSTANTTASPQISLSSSVPSKASASAKTSVAPSSSASVQPSTSASAETGTVDKTITLNFYNGTVPKVPGLSRKAATTLQGQGWTIGTILDWKGAAVDQTTIYIADSSQLATGRAVAKLLGGAPVKLNTRYTTTGIAVVIGNGYQG